MTTRPRQPAPTASPGAVAPVHVLLSTATALGAAILARTPGQVRSRKRNAAAFGRVMLHIAARLTLGRHAESLGLRPPREWTPRGAAAGLDAPPLPSRALIEIGQLSPESLSAAHEQALSFEPEIVSKPAPALHFEPVSRGSRRSSGSFYTPPLLVDQLVNSALEPIIAESSAARTPAARAKALLALRLCDPACGSGNVLVAAAVRLAERIGGPEAFELVCRHSLFGADTDSVALEICRARLWFLAQPDSLSPEELCPGIRMADALASDLIPGEPFDVVVGNPPFLNQLQSATAAARPLARHLHRRTLGAVRGYTDLSAAFLILAIDATRPGGRVALVQPQSLLAARDAGPVRDACLRAAGLESLWFAPGRTFDASVATCIPTFRLRAGNEIEIKPGAPTTSGTWSHVLADARGVPAVRFTAAGTLPDLAHATADFRDQYYGLAGFLIEDADIPGGAGDAEFPPLLTSGLVDLAACRWGSIPTRVLKRQWQAPRVDRRRMLAKGELGPWMKQRLVPKLILATQTRVLEVLADPTGRYLPSTPLITITPRRPQDLWPAAAALASPVCASLALRTYAGAALSTDAIKLSAKQTLELPVPPNNRHAKSAAETLRSAHAAADDNARLSLLRHFGEQSCQAFGLSAADAGQLLRWWTSRLEKSRPRKRSKS